MWKDKHRQILGGIAQSLSPTLSSPAHLGMDADTLFGRVTNIEQTMEVPWLSPPKTFKGSHSTEKLNFIS